ncbi:alpha/beta fold hydrolase [Paraburkholderia bannensis]|uniref:alpha/beta fold hydrolase n=1 Tax=Paraburkholderia bannensis TaxID=765414 RepID=UPI002AB1F227|nr:alpha/beta hydrolase [Paraburkholderia bannensis]
MNQRIDPSLLAPPDLSFATLDSGVVLPYLERGTGEPLLFVHGSLCDYRYWAPQLDGLEDDFRCIAPSLSHYWPAADACIQGEFGWESHLHELAEFIVALGLESVHLVGHSRGGSIAYHLARRYPRLVRTLVLADPGGPLRRLEEDDDVLPPATNALRTRAADLIGNGQLEDGLELFVDSVSMPGAWRKSPQGFREMAIANATTLPKQLDDPLPAYTRRPAADIKCRTLLIDGQRSPLMFRNNVEALDEWIDYAQRVTMKGATHGMNATHADLFNTHVRNFIYEGR